MSGERRIAGPAGLSDPVAVGQAVGCHDARQQKLPHLIDSLFEIGASIEHIRDRLDPGERGDHEPGQHRWFDRGKNISFRNCRLDEMSAGLDPVLVRPRLARCGARAEFEGQPDSRPDDRVLDDLSAHFVAEHDDLLERRGIGGGNGFH